MKGDLQVSPVRDRMQFVTVNTAGCEQEDCLLQNG